MSVYEELPEFADIDELAWVLSAQLLETRGSLPVDIQDLLVLIKDAQEFKNAIMFVYLARRIFDNSFATSHPTSIDATAKQLGMTRPTFYLKLKDCGLTQYELKARLSLKQLVERSPYLSQLCQKLQDAAAERGISGQLNIPSDAPAPSI